MRRVDLAELHYITPISNVPSIMERGILCNAKVERIDHASVAMPEIQVKRAAKQVPGGLRLHQYANLYFSARNPMLYKRRNYHKTLCILRVDAAILETPDVVIADGNAASDYTAFYPSPAGVQKLRLHLVFAENWQDNDQILYWRKKNAKLAEVLVPDHVDARMILGAYVSCLEAKRTLEATSRELTVAIMPKLFFQG